MQLIVAEKPSVARDLARVLGVAPRGEHAFEGERVITWCIGHLVELDEPSAYDGRWKAWRLDTLPMLPETFRLRASKHARAQLRAVARLMTERRFTAIVNACDAGREGELIFAYVYQFAGARLPVSRLWVSSLTDDAIRRGFAALRPPATALADAARSRSEADWLVGMNATRAITVRGGNALLSIGRVQTPTLAMVVARERAIAAFVPEPYCEVSADLAAHGDHFAAWWRLGKRARLDEPIAHAIVARDRGAPAIVESVAGKTVREAPPLLFDLTALQRTANKRFRLSAARTLEIAQALYERHKVLTYPRTDSRYLTRDDDLAGRFATLAKVPAYAPFAQPLVDTPPRPSRRVVDDGKVRDHHAIIPTGRIAQLTGDEQRIFDLVARRFLAVFHGDAEFAVVEAWLRVGEPAGGAPATAGTADERVTALPPPPDRYLARGRTRVVAGWQAVAGIEPAKEDGEALPPLADGQVLRGTYAVVAKHTTPPARYTDATLLAAMESAGKEVTDEALRAAMTECGLGTPATRAATIETLLARGYVVRDKQALVATATGMSLIDALEREATVATLASPELTGAWEARLGAIARGADSRATFMADIRRYVAGVVDAIRAMRPPSSPPAPPAPPAPPVRPARPRRRPAKPTEARRRRVDTAGAADLGCPRCKAGRLIAGSRGWGCTRWREGCRFVVWFETGGRRVTPAQLAALVTTGKTRKTRAGRFVLDVNVDGGAARLVPR